ncbi:unnamed protein product [Phytophthora lilii]|uniref:Unnamed protein product n=1 Tax=Phytophthora lilii TaxID=2077276 RepID=A0A9W6TLW0_9STRA|nr:unnamed protein product [Phytophthora lilii]
MSPDRCKRLVALAHKYVFRIVSDEPYNLLHLDGGVLPSLASYDDSGLVVSLGSFSKILAPGLRLGKTDISLASIHDIIGKVFTDATALPYIVGWAQSSKNTIEALSTIGALRSGGGQNPITAALVHTGEPLANCCISPQLFTNLSALRVMLCGFSSIRAVLEQDLLLPHIDRLKSVFRTRKAALCDALRELETTENLNDIIGKAQKFKDVSCVAPEHWHRAPVAPQQCRGILSARAAEITRRICHAVPVRRPCLCNSCQMPSAAILVAMPRQTSELKQRHVQHGIFDLAKRRESMVTKSKNPMVATTAGAIAGGIETLTIWPMEMIKTNLQLGTMRTQYTGMIGGFRYHVQTDGVGSLYRGLVPVLVGSIPKAGIRFGAFDFIKRRLADEDGKTSAMRNLAAGMMAGAIEATLTTTPVRWLKLLLQRSST